jgi:drug/metabolite transporter (DMT)-like permease
LILASLLWSVVGLLVKGAVTMVDSHAVSFFRFILGVGFLILFMRIARVPLRLELRHPFIYFAALGKVVNYLFENLGIAMGPAWSNLIVGPVATVSLFLLAVFFLGEKSTLRKVLSTLACLGGVVLMRGGGGATGLTWTIVGLMIFSGIGAAAHVFYQRKLVDRMDSLNLNTSIFLVSSLITLAPLPVLGHVTGPVTWLAVGCLLALGLITGLSFHLFALAIRHVPMIQVTILSNVGFLFTPIWAYLAFGSPITVDVMAGAALAISGIILVSLPSPRIVAPVD